MDGYSLTNRLRNVLNESQYGTFIDSRSSYEYIYEAAKKFAQRVKNITSTDTITTVANQTNYDLNSDFNNLYFRNDRNEFVIKYTDSSNNVYWPAFRNYDAIKHANNSTAMAIPSNFSITDKQTLTDPVSGVASANGTVANGECVLTATASNFVNVVVGDEVHNTTDLSNGIVIIKTSNTVLTTALFGGTAGQWAANDAFVIVPQALKQLVLDPAPSASGDTISIEYLYEPAPVYSPYRTYRIDAQYEAGIVYYAAWLYKFRDREPDMADRWYKAWDEMCRRAVKEANKQLGRNKFSVNFIRRSYRDHSYR
jgi:hypothetical protein